MQFFVVIGALCIGSFGNVFLARYPKGKSLWWPPSSCPQCGHAIRWWHNVPVIAWLFLGGRCYDCHRPIPIRYPLMEASFGLLAALVSFHFGLGLGSLFYLVFALLLLLIAWTDWETLSIFDVTTLPLAALGLGASWIFSGRFLNLADAPVAGLEMLALMLLMDGAGRLWAGREVLGAGDVKLMAAGATFLGTQDAWKALALAILLSLPILGAYLWSRGLSRKSPAPFGPALALGLALVGWNQLGHGELNAFYFRVGLPMLGTN